MFEFAITIYILAGITTSSMCLEISEAADDEDEPARTAILVIAHVLAAIFWPAIIAALLFDLFKEQ